MKQRLTSTLKTISRIIPLSLYRQLIKRDVIDFFWHIVSDDPMPHVQHLYPVVPIKEFEAALLYLKENFSFISYMQLHNHVFMGTQIPTNAVHISFDDGYAECYQVVRPLLLKHKIPATFFLTADLIDNSILFYRNKQSLCIDRLMQPDFEYHPSFFKNLSNQQFTTPQTLPQLISWLENLRLSDEPLIDEICRALDVNWPSFLSEKQPYLTSGHIQQMYAEGFTIGAHSLSHRKLVDLSSNEVEREIISSTNFIADMTGQEIVPFSFPHSAWGLDRDHLAQIRSRHAMIGVLFDTKGLHQDVNFIHNRIWAERPLSTNSAMGADRIREHLHLAYQEVWVDAMMKKGRSLFR
jgi:peptidoglycan/xylan/chitin deacetylase (PgdA/CDA1 family)